MTAHVVVERSECSSHDNGLHDGKAPCEAANPIVSFMERGHCSGCLGDGTRVLLEQPQPVESIGYQWESGDVIGHQGEHDRPRVWREVRP